MSMVEDQRLEELEAALKRAELERDVLKLEKDALVYEDLLVRSRGRGRALTSVGIAAAVMAPLALLIGLGDQRAADGLRAWGEVWSSAAPWLAIGAVAFSAYFYLRLRDQRFDLLGLRAELAKQQVETQQLRLATAALSAEDNRQTAE